jgi:hypothetical protein
MEWSAGAMWSMQDDQFYDFLKRKYQDRQKLSIECEEKRKALEKTKETDALYHRMAVSAEMAQLRLDMAYIVDKNTKLEQYVETIGYLHTRLDIVEGAYGHLKLLFETCRLQSAIPKPAKPKETP